MSKPKPRVNQSRLNLKWNSGTKQSKPPMNNHAAPSSSLGNSLAGVKSKTKPIAQISTPIASLNLWRVSLMAQCSLTEIRRRKRRITPAGHGRGLIAFTPAIIAFCVIMTAKTFPTKAAFVIANPKSKLLDQVREVLRVKHYSLRTEEAYVQWVRRFLKFHRDRAGSWKHPRELGAAEVVAFLNHLASIEHVAAATQNQALNAISFLYSQVLGLELGDLGEFLRASRPRRVPVVLSRDEVGRLLASLEGSWRVKVA